MSPESPLYRVQRVDGLGQPRIVHRSMIQDGALEEEHPNSGKSLKHVMDDNTLEEEQSPTLVRHVTVPLLIQMVTVPQSQINDRLDDTVVSRLGVNMNALEDRLLGRQPMMSCHLEDLSVQLPGVIQTRIIYQGLQHLG